MNFLNFFYKYLYLFLSAHKYHSRHEFLRDIEQILENCTVYNGKESPFTQKAELLVKVCKETLDEVFTNFLTSLLYFNLIFIIKLFCTQYDEHLTQLENNILLVQKRAMEQADIDPSWLGPDEENYTIVEPEFRGVQYLSIQIYR